jgi:spermidine synthase
MVPTILDAFTSIHRALEPGWLGSNLIRFGLAFVAVGIPSTLIGATAPAMARLVSRWAGSIGVGFGRFYAVNTIGSVLGAALAGFVLIRVIGVNNTLLCAVAGNVIVVGIALLASRFGGEPDALPPPAATSAPARPKTPADPRTRFALVVAAVAGFVALAYEVAWVRLLAVFTLNSVYVFTMILTVYLAGLAVGSGVAARMLRRGFDPLRSLVLVQLALALFAPLTIGAVPLAVGVDIMQTHASEAWIFSVEYAMALAVALLPGVLIGMTLPLLAGVFTLSVSQAGTVVGRLYAWNAVGTIAGTVVTGLFLIPFLGLRGTLLGLAALNVLIAAAADTLAGRRATGGYAVVPLGAGIFALLVAFVPGDVRFYRPSRAPDEMVVYYAEGPSATVHVTQEGLGEDAYRTLYVDSKSVAGTYDQIVTDQKMLAHLPLLLHPSPERALTVGFGTGGTSYSMTLHGIVVHCVEIEPRVPQAYRLFESENLGRVGPDHDRRSFRLILNDARAWLQVAPDPYDVIVTDITSIQYRDNGNLYTAEYFGLMGDRLQSGGLASAWVPISGITPEQLKLLIRTFLQIYPHASAWYMINMPTDFVILIGGEERLNLDLADIARRMNRRSVQSDLDRIGLSDPYKLAACLLLAEEDLRQYAGTGPIHTDDRPVLDYMTHASPYRNTLTENLREMLTRRSDAADYVTRWPDDASPDEARAKWNRWFAAARHLMEGYAWLTDENADRLPRMRASYQAAVDCVPEDAQTRALLEDLPGK